MTDNEINARVAALRGHTIAQDTDGWYIASDSTHRWPLADYCNDPAAWGALLVWLAGEGREARIGVSLSGKWSAVVSLHPGLGDSPGRALALAALRAHGVEP